MQIGSKIFNFDEPVIMGILNVTPDSFSDGGLYNKKGRAVEHAKKLISEGADIVDIGGESTRPGSESISESEELDRVIPVIKAIRKFSNIPISIDTQKSAVASHAIKSGADMVNDVSAGLHDEKMFDTAAAHNVPICLMHMKDTPKTMQDDPQYKDIMGEIKSYLSDRIKMATKVGILPDRIIVDPGIGFGKTAEDNVKIISNLNFLAELGSPILIGTSRKSFIGKLLDLDVKERLEATLATISKAYDNGARIFRVHEVAPAKKYLSMYKILTETKL